MKSSTSLLILSLLGCLSASGEARSTTVWGEGIFYTAGPYVDVTDNIHVAADFYSGTSFQDSNAHYGVGGRGRTLNGTGIPAGRGVAIGSFGQSHTGACVGVMVEDFTDNQGIPDANDGGETNMSDGLIGPCHSVAFKSNTYYHVDVLISELNVYWYLSEYQNGPYTYGWNIVAEGGCYEDTGYFCPEDPFDRGYGDAFIAIAGLNYNFWWDSSSPSVSKF